MTLFPEPRNEPNGRQVWERQQYSKAKAGYVRCDFYVEHEGAETEQCGQQATWFAGGFSDEASCDEHVDWLRSL